MRVRTFSCQIYQHAMTYQSIVPSQWVIDAMAPDRKDNAVKAKQLEALKRLGHSELKLDEYERMQAVLLAYIIFILTNLGDF